MPSNDYAFGEIQGVPLHSTFRDRASLRDAGVHRPLEAGISGRPHIGAESIVVNGGYDNEDQGDVILYCGQGGARDSSGRLTKDQNWLRGNGGLRKSCIEGLPVRVVRGPKGDPTHSPDQGYRYDGLYFVSDFWEEPGLGGFMTCRFKMTRIFLDPADREVQEAIREATNEIRYVTTQRRVRNTAVTAWVKNLYRHTCQICGVRIDTPAGPYAEGAHIVPLGSPFFGPDAKENVLCLCPTCHVRLDRGAISVSDSFEVQGLANSDGGRPLTVRQKHDLDAGAFARHRAIHSSKPERPENAKGIGK